MQNLESLLASLVADTVQAAGLSAEWADVFRPLFHIEQVSQEGEDEIAITFKYLGATTYFPFTSDPGALADAIAEAAASFGRSLRWEREKFGFLRVPVSGDMTADGSPQDGRVEAAIIDGAQARMRLRPEWSPARKFVIAGAVMVIVALVVYVLCRRPPWIVGQ